MTRAFLTVVACVAIGCGGPTAPSPATLLTIAPGTDLLAIGATATFSAFAARSDGSGAPVVATWTTDNSVVVMVSPQGLATALNAGMATITASYQNVGGSRALRVVPSFAGSWAGGYRTTACSGNSCIGPHAVGGIGTAGVFLTQVRDQVTGFLYLDGVNVPVTGSISVSGTLSLTGDLTFQNSGLPGPYVGVRVDSWTSALDGARTMTGRFTHLYADTSNPFPYPLSNRVDSELVKMTAIGPP